MNRDFTQCTWSPQIAEDLRRIVRLAVFEDLDRGQDWTTISLVREEAKASANVVARRTGTVAGIPAISVILDEMEIVAECHAKVEDGDTVQPGAILATLSGNARDLLTSERIILNVLGRLSGIATLTRQYVDAVSGTTALIYDTRKTTPGWRRLEKYAVQCGGGHNHRTGLFDAILIKDNHLALGREQHGAAAFSPAQAVRRARDFLAQQVTGEIPRGAPDPNMVIEVEVDSLDQLRQVLPERPDIVLLDNMTPEMLRQAVEIREAAASTAQLEASGGINLQTVAAVAATGIERISAGALTHSAVALDISLDWL